jgi:hypothetical protein
LCDSLYGSGILHIFPFKFKIVDCIEKYSELNFKIFIIEYICREQSHDFIGTGTGTVKSKVIFFRQFFSYMLIFCLWFKWALVTIVVNRVLSRLMRCIARSPKNIGRRKGLNFPYINELTLWANLLLSALFFFIIP